MSPTDRLAGLPKWFLALLAGVALAALPVTWRVKEAVDMHLSETRDLAIRMCRLEVAAHLDPWPTCHGGTAATTAASRLRQLAAVRS